MRACRVVALPLLAVLFAVPLARAGDPAVTAFKQRAKFHLSVIKGNAKDALKLVKAGLADAAAIYADGGPAEEALAAAIVAVTSARDELEDGTHGAFVTLAQEGHQILLDNGFPPPGPDFMAGTGGVWDDALADADAALDKADEQLRKAWAGFVKSMVKAAGKQDLQLDIRSQLPPHGENAWSVVPPGGNPVASVLDGGFAGVREPQVLIVARIVETNTSSRLLLGVRSGTAAVDVHLASTDADPANFGTLVRDEFGVATSNFGLSSLDHPQGFVLVHLDDGTFTSRVTAVSAPTLLDPDPAAADVLKLYSQDVKLQKKQLNAVMGGAVADFKQLLGTHLAAVKGGLASPELALRTGFSNLRDAREAIGSGWMSFVAGTASTTSSSLFIAGLDDSALPADFQPDASGFAAKTLAAVLRGAANRERQLSSAYDKFASKILEQAEKDGAQVGASLLLGRGAGFEAPMVTAGNTPPAQPSAPPRIADGLVLVLKPAVTEEFSVLLNLQTEVNTAPTLAASFTSIPDGTTGDLGDFLTGFGGTATDEIPLTADEDLLGWIFEAGKSDTDQPALMILMRPQIVGDAP